jgi:hypothetical protein
MIVFVPALHGMKDEIGVPIYLMIDDFEQISRPINAQPQVFILVAHPLYWPIVQIRPEGMQYVLPVDMVSESGLVKLDDNFVHVSSILPPFFPVNAPLVFFCDFFYVYICKYINYKLGVYNESSD